MQHTTTRRLKGLSFMILGMLSLSPLAYGDLLSEERVRRMAATQEAQDLLMEGRKMYADNNYEEAVRLYREALNRLPFGPKTEPQRNEIAAHLADGSVALSQQYRRLGKYPEARTLLEDVQQVDPGNYRAYKSLEYLDDPIRTNPSLTYEHSENVDEVRRLLYKGEGFYNLADYDKAEEQFKAVLRIDRYNKAARRWLEKCAAIKSDYYRAAYDEARARLLMQVDAAWELAVPPENEQRTFITGTQTGPKPGQQQILDKLRSIIIPIVDFQDTPLDEAMDYLRQKSIELDPSTNAEQKGINFVVQTSTVSPTGDGLDANLGADDLLLGGDVGGKTIESLRLRNVPLATVLQFVCDATSLRYRVDEFAVTLLPLTGGGVDEFITRTWTVPPTFIADLSDSGSSDAGAIDDPFAPESTLGGGGIEQRKSVQQILLESGVDFPAGATATIHC